MYPFCWSRGFGSEEGRSLEALKNFKRGSHQIQSGQGVRCLLIVIKSIWEREDGAHAEHTISKVPNWVVVVVVFSVAVSKE